MILTDIQLTAGVLPHLPRSLLTISQSVLKLYLKYLQEFVPNNSAPVGSLSEPYPSLIVEKEELQMLRSNAEGLE